LVLPQWACMCACGRRGARAGVGARMVLGERPQRLGRDANATSRGGRIRRGRGVGGARRGAASKEAGTAGSRDKGAHAHARVLASQGRGVAVPCAGHRHPGPAARRGGGRATEVAGTTVAHRAPAQKTARRPEGERMVLRLATEGPSAALGITPAARGSREGRRRCGSLAGLEQGVLGAAEGRSRGEAVQGRAARVRRCRRSGRRLGEDAPAVAAVSSSSGSPPAPSPLLRCGDGGLEKGHGWLEFKRAARVLMRGAGARVRSRPGLLGVRAGTRGGIAARLGLGFAVRVVGVREKGARSGCAALSRSGDRHARLAGHAREEKRKKGGGRLEASGRERECRGRGSREEGES
jgi:hypothetical protein